jgi:hypothetical protein
MSLYKSWLKQGNQTNNIVLGKSLILLISVLSFHRLSRILTQNNVMDDLTLSLLSVLLCSVCKEYMVPPITFCENVHNMCISCRKLIRKCSTCLKPLLNMLNTPLEYLVTNLQFPCRKGAYGCTELLHINCRISHNIICPFRFHTLCPHGVIQGLNCDWKGHISVLLYHFFMYHNTVIIEVQNSSMLTVPCKCCSLSYKLVSVRNKLFFYVWEVRSWCINLSVFNIG